jgi:hypothetical protein
MAAQPVPGEAPFRYGVVFLLILGLVMFEIIAPTGTLQRAIALGLAGAALVVAVATWRTHTLRERRIALVIASGVAVMVVGVASGILGAAFEAAAATLVLVAIPATLARGLFHLVSQRGATVQAIAGALSVYLMLGLLFASVIGFIAEVTARPYFVQGAGVTNGDRVYFSFTTLTTTGYGDYTAATSVGHAVAVLEMLTGQIYLITVIGVLIGHYVRGRD